MMPSPIPVSVVVHTHWDREWYATRETFAARLVRVMQRVIPMLESGRLQSFLLDGQTAAYEDFARTAPPAWLARLQALIRAGRVQLGPWYVAPDEFLVQGECLVRNLQLGVGDVHRLGGDSALAGYLPDTFGHVAQMPAILAEFEIGLAVLWRGADAISSEFDWQALDGTRCATLYLSEGYYQHPLNVPDYVAALTRYLDAVAPRSLARHLLLTQGGDHLAPHRDISDRLQAFNAAQTTYVAKESTLTAYAHDVLGRTAVPRPVLEGELRRNQRAFVLPDVLSTRRYLKRAHQSVEDRLLGEIEPCLAMLDMGKDAVADLDDYLEATWRLLITQQAHDSICGCSIDRVHQEMMTRFDQLNDRLDALMVAARTAAGMRDDGQYDRDGGDVFADDSQFTLFNPLPHVAFGPHVIKCFLRGEASAFTLIDERGTRVPCTVLSVRPHHEFHSPLDEFPDRVGGMLYELAIASSLPGLGHRVLQVKREPGPHTTALTRMGCQIDHPTWRVTCEAGRINLTYRPTGRVYSDVFTLTSELDAGDTYNYAPPPLPQQSRNSHWEVEEIRTAGTSAAMVLATTLRTPAGLDIDRTGASRATVINKGRLTLHLLPESDVIELTLEWTNEACDQRTRLVIQGLDPDRHLTYSDTAFACTERCDAYACYPDQLTRTEMPPVVQPSSSCIVAHPFWLSHRALHEYEVLAHPRRLALTIVRSVGWLSRRDVVTRGVGAGPDLATPQAQCLGPSVDVLRFGYLTSSQPPCEALSAARALRRPVIALRGVARGWHAGCTLTDTRIEVSAVRRITIEEQAFLELRLWNPLGEPLQTGLTAPWHRVYADGRSHPSGIATLAPYAIMTVRRPWP